jgi:hypothetical protein
MPVKILQKPEGKFGSAIIGVEGELRVLDQSKACKGYQSCCQCPACLRREAQHLNRPKPSTCQCDPPLTFDDYECSHCGKHLAKQAA